MASIGGMRVPGQHPVYRLPKGTYCYHPPVPPAPVLLDLFCGAGGASMGYHHAGYHVIGVDLAPQPNYPFTFIRADWSTALDLLVLSHRVDAIHASPPCQAYSAPRSVNGDRGHPALLESVRAALPRLGIPYVIENVVGSPLRRDLLLCGEMFNLPVIRHRIFQTNFPITQPAHPTHRGRVRGWRHGVYHDGPYLAVYGKGGGKASFTEARDALQVPWMQTREEVIEAIPPSYTKLIGSQLLAHSATLVT